VGAEEALIILFRSVGKVPDFYGNVEMPAVPRIDDNVELNGYTYAVGVVEWKPQEEGYDAYVVLR
jgi:hypothetical protein